MPSPDALPRPATPGRVGLPHADLRPDVVDVAIAGGGCAGLALAEALAVAAPHLRVGVVDGRRAGRDPRTWSSWADGCDPVPEAVGASWASWEIRRAGEVVTASDPDHPYRMVRAADYRAAMSARADARPATTTLHAGAHVRGITEAGIDTTRGELRASTVVDARGPLPLGPPQPGRVRLHQRFLGQWIRTTTPVFDPTTATLMDFDVGRPDADTAVRFVYVLPVSATEALVEATAFLPGAEDPEPFRDDVARYVARRWGLAPHEWTVVGEEAGSIPMTDEPVPAGPVAAVGVRAGITRPSSGYAYARIQRQARQVARALATGSPVPAFRDPWRTRALDAVFLRFLRDQPERAPEVFARMFRDLPGPLTVRFLTERATLGDELRLVLALPKIPFLRAAAATGVDLARRIRVRVRR